MLWWFPNDIIGTVLTPTGFLLSPMIPADLGTTYSTLGTVGSFVVLDGLVLHSFVACRFDVDLATDAVVVDSVCALAEIADKDLLMPSFTVAYVDMTYKKN